MARQGPSLIADISEWVFDTSCVQPVVWFEIGSVHGPASPEVPRFRRAGMHGIRPKDNGLGRVRFCAATPESGVAAQKRISKIA